MFNTVVVDLRSLGRMFAIGVLAMGLLVAQPKHTYVPESAERTARPIPALFELTGTLPPLWSDHALLGVQDNQTNGPMIYIIDREGRRDQFSFTFADSGTIYVHGLALSTEGKVAITGAAVSRDSRAGSFLAIVQADRSRQTVVRTWPYVPWDVVFVPDGSLWTVGYTFHDTEDRIVEPNVMSHYDSAGKLLQSFPITAKARFGPGQSAALQHSFLRTSADRIGWFTNGMEYIESAFDGRELARFDGPDVPDPVEAVLRASFALSQDNQALFSTIENASVPQNGPQKTPKRRTWALNRENHEWVSVDFQDPNLPLWSMLLGFDGNTLVIGNLHEMRRYKRPTSASAQQ